MAYFDKYGVEFSDDKKMLVCCPKDFQGEYVIPDGVTSIEDFAFSNCTGLTSVTIPESVCNIGLLAFDGCESLPIEDSLLYADTYLVKAFNIDKPTYKIKEGTKWINQYAFDKCEELTSIFIPSSVSCILDNVLSGRSICSICVDQDNATYKTIDGVLFSKDGQELLYYPEGRKDKQYNIPKHVISIGTCAFADNKYLTTIIIPEGVKTIGDYAFSGCHKITSLAIPNSVTEIGDSAFLFLPNVIYSGIANGSPWEAKSMNGYVEDELVYKDSSKKELLACFPSVEGNKMVPNTVTRIGGWAFSYCTGLTTVTIPNSVTSIGGAAFYNCSGLTSVTIPNSVTSIGDRAFLNCIGLTSVTIGNSVTSIGMEAFGGCSGLTSVTIPNSVTSIGDEAFRTCTGLTSVTIPNSVTSIGGWAFSYCTGLTSVTIPNSVTTIGSSAFSGCSGLREIIVPLGQKARFAQMEGLKDKIVERDNEELTILLNLAKAYEFGIGVSQSIAQAVLIYTQATEKGCAEAAYHLAEWYKSGEVLPLDFNKALDLYKQAARSGFSDAEEKVQRIQQKIEENEKPYYLFFDTETTGLPLHKLYNSSPSRSEVWPRMVQLAWMLTNKEGKILKKKSVIIQPIGFLIPRSASAIHHITTERARQEGVTIQDVLEEFISDLSCAERIVGHNIDFDQRVVSAELHRNRMGYDILMEKPRICTMHSSTVFCAIPNPNGDDDYKWPKLSELYRKLFNRDFEDAHDALADITATKDCFFELKRRGVIKE